MRPDSPIPIRTIDELRVELPRVLDAVNRDPGLAIAAAMNPLLLLAEFGYALSDEVVAEIEERGRFSKRQIARRRRALARIDELAKGRADLSSADAIAGTLESLGLAVRPDLDRPGRRSGILNFSDAELARNKGRHAIFDALIELRSVEAAAREFAPEATFRKVRSGELRVPAALRFTARLSNETDRPPNRSRRGDA